MAEQPQAESHENDVEGSNQAQQPVDESNIDGFWLFNYLKEEPYGLMPLGRLTAKGGPTTIKSYKRVASYTWYLEDQFCPTIIVPGSPNAFAPWNGGKLPHDNGVLIYDINHLKIPSSPLDPLFVSVQKQAEQLGNPTPNFQDFDVITDSVNLQKLFAFCQEGNEGLFRIDVERIGKTILLSRVEASDMIRIDYESYDQILKLQCTKGKERPLTGGPFFQVASYTFGDLKFLVRFEADCGDYTKLPGWDMYADSDPNNPPELAKQDLESLKTDLTPDEDEKRKFSWIPYGNPKLKHHLMTMSACPVARGFPFFTWAQLFFSGADSTVVGWWKGNGDFTKPAIYGVADVSKLIKPLPYNVLSKVHDCLVKIKNFMTTNEEDLKIALLWKGIDSLEIYEKEPDAPNAVSPEVYAQLKEQVPQE